MRTNQLQTKILELAKSTILLKNVQNVTPIIKRMRSLSLGYNLKTLANGGFALRPQHVLGFWINTDVILLLKRPAANLGWPIRLATRTFRGPDEVTWLDLRAKHRVQQRHRAIRARLTQDTIHATEDGTEDAARVRAAGLQIANKARCCEARRAENRLDCGQAGSGKLRLKGQSKDSICELGLVITLEASCRSITTKVAFSILAQVLGLERATIAGAAGVVHDSGFAMFSGSDLEIGQQFLDEQEMREVIGVHLDIEAVFGGFVREGHDASIAGEHIECSTGPEVAFEGCLHGADTGEVLQVTRDTHEDSVGAAAAEGFHCLCGPGRITIQKHHLCTLAGTNLSSNVTCACGCARDRHALALHGRQCIHEIREPDNGWIAFRVFLAAADPH